MSGQIKIDIKIAFYNTPRAMDRLHTVRTEPDWRGRK